MHLVNISLFYLLFFTGNAPQNVLAQREGVCIDSRVRLAMMKARAAAVWEQPPDMGCRAAGGEGGWGSCFW